MSHPDFFERNYPKTLKILENLFVFAYFQNVIIEILLIFLQMENPWNIQSIYEFQYFNCPSCVFKNHSKQEFVKHAYEFHPESIDYFTNICDGSLKDVECPWNMTNNTEELIFVDSNLNQNDENRVLGKKNDSLI